MAAYDIVDWIERQQLQCTCGAGNNLNNLQFTLNIRCFTWSLKYHNRAGIISFSIADTILKCV